VKTHALSRLPNESAWLWISGMLQKLNLDLQQAIRLKNKKEIIMLFRKYRSLPTLPVPPNHMDTETKLLSALNTLRTQALPIFWERRIRVKQPNFEPLDLSIVTDSERLENKAIPTSTVLRTQSVVGVIAEF